LYLRSARARSVRVASVERLFTVEFGPSRSKRFGRALAEARRGARTCSEIEPGRYRATFPVGEDAAAYAVLASFLARVRHWRATEVYEGDEPVSPYHAKEMAWCACSQLKAFGSCRVRFFFGVFPRCARCPLLDCERAIRDALGENPPPGTVFKLTLEPGRQILPEGELLPDLGEGPELDVEVPDFPPEEWRERGGQEPG
jgi:hypothetical protein